MIEEGALMVLCMAEERVARGCTGGILLEVHSGPRILIKEDQTHE